MILTGIYIGAMELLKVLVDHELILTVGFFVILIIPPTIIGFKSRTRKIWSVIVSPLCFLVAWLIQGALEGFDSLLYEIGSFGFALTILILWTIMILAFGAGLGIRLILVKPLCHRR
jgi:hypothetical protein